MLQHLGGLSKYKGQRERFNPAGCLPLAVDEADWELLQGMGNCYEVCGEDFENTVRMVARSRGLTTEEVRQRLRRIKEEVGETEEYRRLRSRMPEDFPL